MLLIVILIPMVKRNIFSSGYFFCFVHLNVDKIKETHCINYELSGIYQSSSLIMFDFNDTNLLSINCNNSDLLIS